MDYFHYLARHCLEGSTQGRKKTPTGDIKTRCVSVSIEILSEELNLEKLAQIFLLNGTRVALVHLSDAGCGHIAAPWGGVGGGGGGRSASGPDLHGNHGLLGADGRQQVLLAEEL